MSAAFGIPRNKTIRWLGLAAPKQPVVARSAAQRDAGIDALRAALTLLVLFHHAAHTYSSVGGWYYSEVQAEGAFGTKLLRFFLMVNQAYFMGLFFLIAGYFTPGAVGRNGPWAYLAERALRLGVPLLVYRFFIGPATVALASTAAGRPFLATLRSAWAGGDFRVGPLWFVETLLIFTMAYVVWRALMSRLRPAQGPATPFAFPSNIALVAAVLATGAGAFALRLVWPVGAQAFGLQLGNFASYVVLFAAGCAGASSGCLTSVPDAQRRLWPILALLALPVLPIVGIVAPAAPVSQGNMLGGWNIMAAAYAFWEPLVACGLILALLHAFRGRFTMPGPIWSALSRRAYAIYIIHPPVLVAIALVWRDVPAPPVVKFALTGAAACLACFWLAGLLLLAPWVRRIL